MNQNRICRRLFGACLFLLVATFVMSSGLEAQDTSTKTWTGTLDVGAAKLRLEIQITSDGENQIGKLISLDQNNATLNMKDIVTKDKLEFSVPQIGAKFSGAYEKDGKVAKGTFTQGRGFPLTLTLDKTEAAKEPLKKAAPERLIAAWVGELEMGIVKPVMQFRVVQKADGTRAAYFDSVTEGRTDFPAEYSMEDGTIKFAVEEIRLSYEATLNKNGDEAEGTWKQGRQSYPLTVKKQSYEYDNENVWENRPQKPVGPFPYDSEDVKFENKRDDLTLAGTLTIPKKPGRHPAVILISGSGAQDRDESLMGHKPFLVLADYLSRRGIAVLRYDDRGTAESTGVFDEATTDDFAHDASAAVEFLKSHDRINATEIGLAGHSEGGLIAPLVCSLRNDVAFICLLAGTGVDGATIIPSQTEAMLRAMEMPEESIKVEMAISNALINTIVENIDKEDVSGKIDEAIEATMKTALAGESEEDRKVGEEKIRSTISSQKDRLLSKWMLYFLTLDPKPALKKVNCPVLAIIGSKDLQVLPELNMPEIEAALKEGGNKDYEMVILKDLNHLFQKCETGSVSEYATIKETFNPEAMKRIGDWIVEHTTVVK